RKPRHASLPPLLKRVEQYLLAPLDRSEQPAPIGQAICIAKDSDPAGTLGQGARFGARVERHEPPESVGDVPLAWRRGGEVPVDQPDRAEIVQDHAPGPDVVMADSLPGARPPDGKLPCRIRRRLEAG